MKKVYYEERNMQLSRAVENQKNGLKTRAKALIPSVVRPDTFYFGNVQLHFEY